MNLKNRCHIQKRPSRRKDLSYIHNQDQSIFFLLRLELDPNQII
jgi:hypothetical protein